MSRPLVVSGESKTRATRTTLADGVLSFLFPARHLLRFAVRHEHFHLDRDDLRADAPLLLRKRRLAPRLKRIAVLRLPQDAMPRRRASLSRRHVTLPIGICAWFDDAATAFAHVDSGMSSRAVLLPDGGSPRRARVHFASDPEPAERAQGQQEPAWCESRGRRHWGHPSRPRRAPPAPT
jgi:hypothetical protein